MDFNDTPEEAAFRAEARAWLEANAMPRAAAGGSAAQGADVVWEWARAWQKKKADAGWACITWPREYGGRDATSMQAVIWGQEEARFRVPPLITALGTGLVGPTLMAHGTEEQKQRWLPKILTGEEFWCELFSEPSAGSDLAGVRTSAARDGDAWVVNGHKVWTSGARYSDWGILLTRTHPDEPKHAGMTYFVVDMKTPGIQAHEIKQINAAAEFCEVFFEDVRIPDENRIGKAGGGWRVALTTLMHERGGLGGSGGESRDLIESLLDLARGVEVDGAPALEDTAVRQQIADFYIRRKGIEYTRYRTLTALSRAQAPGPEGSLGKLVGGRLMQEMGSFGMDLAGRAGTLGGQDAGATSHSDMWRDRYLSAPALRIAGGSDEILRNIIAERVLGLPREPRTDRDVPFKAIPTANSTK